MMLLFYLVLLVLGSYPTSVELSLVANVNCQFMSMCDLMHVLRPVIDSMDSQITKMSHFEKTALMKIYELTERMEIIEEQLGVPYWSIKPTKKPPIVVPNELSNNPESLPYMLDDYHFSRTTLPRNSHRNRVHSGPLLTRVADVEKWKDVMEHETVPGLITNMREILSQIGHYDSVPRTLELHEAKHMATQDKLVGLEQQLEQLGDQLENLDGRVEHKTKRNQELLTQMIQIQAQINVDVEDLKKDVSSFNVSANVPRERLEELEQHQISLNSSFRGELKKQSDVSERHWKGFHDDLHVLIEDVMRLEDQQLAYEDKEGKELSHVNARIDDMANETTLNAITEFKEHMQNEFTELLKDVPSKQEIVSLWGGINNLTNNLEKTKEEFHEEVSLLQLQVRNLTTLPFETRLGVVESTLKWREKQIQVNLFSIDDLFDQVELLSTELEQNTSLLYGIVENIFLELSQIKENQNQLINEVKKELSTSSPQTVIEWNAVNLEEMPGDAVAEFLVYKKPCNFTVPEESSHVLASLDGRPLDHYQQSLSISSGHVIKFRCRQVGNFQFSGDIDWTCDNGDWQNSGEIPHCMQLLTEELVEGGHVDANRLMPSIQIIPLSGNDSIGFTPSGELVALPGSGLLLNCIYPKSLGMPQWSKTIAQSKYFIPGRWLANSRLRHKRIKGEYKYQIMLANLREDQSAKYTCDAGRGRFHSIQLIVNEVKCPMPSVDENILISSTAENKMHSKLSLHCKNPNDHLVWHENNVTNNTQNVYCLPSGKWSHDFPSSCSQ